MEPLGPSDPTRIASYRLVARLGSGGMGQVFLARSPGGRPVALKVIRPDLVDDSDFRGRFVREVAAARAVSGVFTAPVLDADPHGTPAWLATGYVPGVPLDEAITRFRPLPAPAVVTLAAGLAEALAAVHAAGLVHRDVKPSNVILSPDGPKLIDFGIARPTVGASSHTQTGVVIGSPAFFAPEQVSGGEIGPPADVFALASVLVFALTGATPFRSADQLAVLYRVVHAEPILAGVPDALLEIVEACLAKTAADRPTPQRLLELLHPADDAGGDGRWHLPGPLSAEIVRRSAELFGPERPPQPRPRPGGEPPGERRSPVLPARPEGASGSGPRRMPPGRRSDGLGVDPSPPRPAPPPRPARPRPHPSAAVSVDPEQTGIHTHLDSTGSPDAPDATPAPPDAGRAPTTGPATASDAPDAPEQPARADEPVAPTDEPARPRRRWRTLPILVAVGAILLAAVLLVVLQPKPVGVEATIAVGDNPTAITVGGGYLWVANSSGQSISRIDPSTGETVEFAVGGVPMAVAFTGDTLWVWNYPLTVTPVDVTTLTPFATVEVPPEYPISGIAAGGDFLWLVSESTNTMGRISVASRQLEDRPITVTDRPGPLAAGNDRMYLVSMGDDTLSAFDLASAEVLGQPLALPKEAVGVTVQDGVVYVGSGSILTTVDEATDAIGTSIPIEGAAQFQPGGGAVWVTYPLENQVRRLSPATLEVQNTLTNVGAGVTATAYAEGSLWLAVGARDEVVRIGPA